MWAHYCDRHTGFIFELEPNHAFFTTLKKHDPVKTIRPAVYSERLPHIREMEDFFKDNAGLDALLFTKDKRWEYEKEWRLIADKRDAARIIPVKDGDDIWLFSLPPDCIKRVVLGCLMAQSRKQEFIDLMRNDARYSHVQLQEAVRVAESYDLTFKDI
jgi:hypothetical protein